MTKKAYYIFLSILAILMLGAVLVTSKPETAGYTEQKQAEIKKSTTYTVCDLDGKIAVYQNNDETPLYVYSVLVKTLPLPDQEALKNGIKLDSNEKLIRLIEDYTS